MLLYRAARLGGLIQLEQVCVCVIMFIAFVSSYRTDRVVCERAIIEIFIKIYEISQVLLRRDLYRGRRGQ